MVRWARAAGGFLAVATLALVGLTRLLGAHWNLAMLLLFAWVAGSGLWAAVSLRKEWTEMVWHASRVRQAEAGLRALSWVMVCAAILYAVIPAQLGEEIETVRLTVVGLGLGAFFLELVVPKEGWRPSSLLAIGLGLMFGWDLAFGLTAPRGQHVVMNSPFAVEFLVFHGGGSPLMNYHYGVWTQRDALDLEILHPSGSAVDGDPAILENYACFGVPVQAIRAGRVVGVEAGLPDMAIGEMDGENLAGNHVILDHGDGIFSLSAHLQAGSVAVAEGDEVSSGQMLGRCGNSGNTSEPHLHLQVQTLGTFSPTDPELTTRPIWFDGVLVKRGANQLSGPTWVRRNDVVVPQ